MGVIGDLELVLDDDDIACGLVVADEVEAEVAHRVLSPFKDEIHPEKIGQDINVREQPRREVEGLMRPYVSRSDDLETTKRRNDCHGRDNLTNR
ncbi:hypothetical protein GCM10027448_38990 [Nocardioides dilutus]